MQSGKRPIRLHTAFTVGRIQRPFFCRFKDESSLIVREEDQPESGLKAVELLIFHQREEIPPIFAKSCNNFEQILDFQSTPGNIHNICTSSVVHKYFRIGFFFQMKLSEQFGNEPSR